MNSTAHHQTSKRNVKRVNYSPMMDTKYHKIYCNVRNGKVNAHLKQYKKRRFKLVSKKRNISKKRNRRLSRGRCQAIAKKMKLKTIADEKHLKSMIISISSEIENYFKCSHNLNKHQLKELQKYMALRVYYHLRLSINQNTIIDNKTRAVKVVSDIYGFSNPTFYKYRNAFEHSYEIPESKQGCHRKIQPGLNSVQLINEFKLKIDSFINSKKRFNAESICKWVNEELLQEKVRERGRPFSTRTISRWMVALEYKWGLVKKGIYYDGHDREDVVQV